MSIRKALLTTKIRSVQIDPFGFCNAKCWFCPVRYKPQPEVGSSAMSVDLLEKILSEIDAEKKKPNGLIEPSLELILTAHYNEVLLYKHIEDLFKLLRKYNLKTFVLSNGISLHKDKVDLIKEYLDVIPQVGLNIPAFERELWASRSGFSPDQFDRLMGNLRYAEEQFNPIKYNIQIHVNGVDASDFVSKTKKGNGFEELGINLDMRTGEHEAQYWLARKLFPKWHVTKSSLFDRAGSIDILNNQDYIRQVASEKQVVGCNSWGGDRVTQWLHVNSAGQTFLCCNDYNFDYTFGDLSVQTLEQIWASDRHVQVLDKALDQFCSKCMYAVFDK